MPVLQYEPNAKGRPVTVEQDGQVTRIVVAMQGWYLPIPHALMSAGGYAIILIPLWCIGAFLLRLCLRSPKPPRAVFEITSEHLTMTSHDHRGEVTTIKCPRTSVAEARSNRFEPGLWLNVPGHVKHTFLHDVPRETIAKLEVELRSALGLNPAP